MREEPVGGDTGYGRTIELAYPDQCDWVLGRILQERATTHADTVFLDWCRQARLTFAETNSLVNRYAHGLARLGVGHGDRFALLLPNCLEYVLVWLALAKLGAVEVPVNLHYRREFLDHALTVSGATWVLTDERLLAALAECAPQTLGALRGVLVRDGAASAGPAGLPPSRSLASVLDVDDSEPGVPVSYTDPAAVLFTSGTTGPAKAVQMSHSHMYFFAQQCVDLVQLGAGDVYLNPYPLYHGNAQFLTVYPSLIAGSTAVLMERFSASRWRDWVADSGATVVNLLGVSMEYLLNQPGGPDDALPSLRTVYAVPRSDALLPLWRERFGDQQFVTSFGQTEVGWPLMGPRGETAPAGAVGKVVSEYYEVRLVDPETDQEVPDGELGELVVRSRVPFTTCDGYLKGDMLDYGPVRNQWWHTGDGMRCDGQGWFYFVDRTNDAMRVRGENVSSFEVEQAVLSFPGVVECAAIGVPSDVAGGEHEIEIVLVVRDPASFSPAELVRHCNARAPWFAVPRFVRVVDELPKTPNEKVIKKQLRAAAAAGGDEVWDRVAAGVQLERS